MPPSRIAGYNFINLAERILSTLGEINHPLTSKRPQDGSGEYILTTTHHTIPVSVRFYRSSNVAFSIIYNAAIDATISNNEDSACILLVSCYVAEARKIEVQKELGVVIWDRSNLANFILASGDADLLESLTSVLLDAQQGINITNPLSEIENTPLKVESYFSNENTRQQIPITTNLDQDDLLNNLDAVPEGKEGCGEFENICEKTLKYLFEEDLALWSRQRNTDDELSRFDLICRIKSQDDFWTTLINSFSSRYILFEFKNYSHPIAAGQIYSTERYLFPRALRACCILIARNGPSKGAKVAAKGALRESGKLIIILSKNDLKIMIQKRIKGESPSDYLSEILDNILVSLSR